MELGTRLLSDGSHRKTLHNPRQDQSVTVGWRPHTPRSLSSQDFNRVRATRSIRRQPGRDTGSDASPGCEKVKWWLALYQDGAGEPTRYRFDGTRVERTDRWEVERRHDASGQLESRSSGVGECCTWIHDLTNVLQNSKKGRLRSTRVYRP